MIDRPASEARVALRETTRDDLAAVMGLWNDGRVMGWVGFPDGLGYDAARMAAWWDRLHADASRRHFVIEADGIGFCGEAFVAVDEARRRAGLDIKLRPEAQGRGIGTGALRMLIERVFADEAAVDAVWTEPSPENHAARRLYERCGLAPAARPDDLPPGESYWERRRSSTPTEEPTPTALPEPTPTAAPPTEEPTPTAEPTAEPTPAEQAPMPDEPDGNPLSSAAPISPVEEPSRSQRSISQGRA